MTALKLKYVKEFTSAGKVYRYVRRRDCKDIPLPGLPGSAEFMEAYQVALAGLPSRPTRHAAGTVGELIARYYASVEFTNRLKPSSRALYRQALDPVSQAHGHRSVKGLDETQARKIIQKIGAKHPGMANLTRAVMRIVMDFGRIAPDPFKKVPQYKLGSRHSWTEEQLLAYEARWPLGTRERLAYAALLWTAQRAGDVVKMRRPAPTATAINLVQEKTGTAMSIPIHPLFRAAIKAGPSKGVFLIGDESGRQISRHSLTRIIRRAVKEAGLPAKCLPHGLRKAQLRRLAESGATAKQIQAIGGHKTLKEVERYTAAANQQLLAASALELLK
jgi:integrase